MSQIKIDYRLATKWYNHKTKWRACQRCPLHNDRTGDTVLYRGNLPCDVLFIGEAPGDSEAALKIPFIGPSGKYLDDWIITAACSEYGKALNPKLGWTNIVACHPKSPSGETIPPKKDHIVQCSSRLSELLEIASPKQIVLVGQIASKYIPNIPFVKITHPACVLRMTKRGEKEIACHHAITKIRQAFENALVERSQ